MVRAGLESPEPMPISHWPRFLAALLIALAVGLAALGAVDHATWRTWGGALRRPDDVTVERVARLRHGLALFAAIFVAIGLFLALWHRQAVRFVADLIKDIAELPASIHVFQRTQCAAAKACFVAILACGIAFRCGYIQGPMDYDEAYTFLNFARRSIVEAIADYNTTNNHLLNTFCMHWCWRLFGQQEWALRLPTMVAGVLLVLMAGIWSRQCFGRGVAITTMALTACCPLLVYYSTNARGYMFLTVAALALDLCTRRLATNQRFASLSMCGATAATTLGLWALPNMLHAIAASTIVFLFLGLRRSNKSACVQFATALASGIVVAATLWFPAYVFRGTMAFEHPFVRPLPIGEWARAMPVACVDAAVSWCQGPLAFSFPWLEAESASPAENTWRRAMALAPWLVAAAASVVVLMVRRASGLPFLIWPAGILLCMTLQRVAPPVRVFLFLAPCFFAGLAFLLQNAIEILSVPSWVRMAALLAYLLCHAGYFAKQPVAYDPFERSIVRDVPALVDAIADENARARSPSWSLLAPLPCDVPALFYAAKRDLPLLVNDKRMPMRPVWVATARSQGVPDTFANVAVRDNLPATELPTSQAERWRQVRTIGRLRLWRNEP